MADFAKDYGVEADQVRKAGLELKDLSKQYGELGLDITLAAGGALPPPAGTIADVASLSKSIAKGDWWGAAFDLVGFVPLAGDAVKGGRVAWKLSDLRRVIDELTTGFAKTFSKTEDAASAFWASKKNMKAYKEALKDCTGRAACKDAAALKKGKQYEKTPKSGPGKGKWEPDTGRGDGEWVPEPGSKLAEAIKPKTSINYENGFPKFDDFSKGEVKIPQTGSHSGDFKLSDEMYRKQIGDPKWKRPDGMTWHHKEDGTTMQLVPSNVNGNAGHYGGASLFKIKDGQQTKMSKEF